MSLNRTHQNGLVSRIRQITRDIRMEIKANNVVAANTLAENRKQIISMAMASGVKLPRIQSAIA